MIDDDESDDGRDAYINGKVIPGLEIFHYQSDKFIVKKISDNAFNKQIGGALLSSVEQHPFQIEGLTTQENNQYYIQAYQADIQNHLQCIGNMRSGNHGVITLR